MLRLREPAPLSPRRAALVAGGGRRDVPLPRFPELPPHLVFHWPAVHTADELRLLIRGVLDELARQRVVYAEICISAVEYVRQGIPWATVVGCLDEATRHPRVRVQWIVDLVWDSGPESALAQLRELLAQQSPAIVGITLGGSEAAYPARDFREVYDLARRHGLRLSVHAGEALGPGSVREALAELRPDRIGHGVRAMEDPELVAHLAAQQVPLEVCPTSNVFTGIYPSLAAHPARRLFEAGVPVTINSDDPTFFHTTLADEYTHLPALGFSDREILQLLCNGFRYAFLPEEQIARYLGDLAEEWENTTLRPAETRPEKGSIDPGGRLPAGLTSSSVSLVEGGRLGTSRRRRPKGASCMGERAGNSNSVRAAYESTGSYDVRLRTHEFYSVATWSWPEWLLAQMPRERVRTVLDVGCGTGGLLRELAAAGIGERWLGIDQSEAMVHKAQALAKEAAGHRVPAQGHP